MMYYSYESRPIYVLTVSTVTFCTCSMYGTLYYMRLMPQKCQLCQRNAIHVKVH